MNKNGYSPIGDSQMAVAWPQAALYLNELVPRSYWIQVELEVMLGNADTDLSNLSIPPRPAKHWEIKLQKITFRNWIPDTISAAP